MEKDLLDWLKTQKMYVYKPDLIAFLTKVIWCDLTEEAIKLGYKKGGNKEQGRVIGESRDKKQWYVRWDGIKSSYRYDKNLIKLI